MKQQVNHPKHYNRHPRGIECIEIVQHCEFGPGNAFKYLWRAGEKPGVAAVDDLRKAAWYIKHEMERLVNDKELIREVVLGHKKRRHPDHVMGEVTEVFRPNIRVAMNYLWLYQFFGITNFLPDALKAIEEEIERLDEEPGF